MDINLRDSIREIILRTVEIEHSGLIQKIALHLKKTNHTNLSRVNTRIRKEKEVTELVNFIEQNNFWFNNIDENKYAGEGAEQKVYLDEDGRHVL